MDDQRIIILSLRQTNHRQFNYFCDPAASKMAGTPVSGLGTAPPVGEGQLIVFRGIHVRRQRRVDLDP